MKYIQKYLKKCKEIVSEQLAVLFRISLDSGESRRGYNARFVRSIIRIESEVTGSNWRN